MVVPRELLIIPGQKRLKWFILRERRLDGENVNGPEISVATKERKIPISVLSVNKERSTEVKMKKE